MFIMFVQLDVEVMFVMFVQLDVKVMLERSVLFVSV